jgi:hypothetical protein
MDAMKHQFKKKITSLHFGVTVLSVFLVLTLVILFIEGRNTDRLETEYEKWIEKAHLVQTMRSELLASAEAEKSAVMAYTDEASRAFAEQSEQSSQNVEKARIALVAIIEKNGNEAKSLDQLSAAWEKLRGIDRQILSLAVQNTNLKALHLSIGPAAAKLEYLQAALDKLMDWAADPSINEAGVVRLCDRVLTESLTLHALETPHIVESTNARMDIIEAKMRQSDERVHHALNRLDAIVQRGAVKPLIAEARHAFKEFQTIHEEIINLSRRNTNIRSFVESLDQKRQMMTLCLSQLNALQEMIKENAPFKATR